MLGLLAAAASLVLPGLGLELALVPRSPGPLVRAIRAFLASLAFRPIHGPHISQIHWKEIGDWAAKCVPRYLYVGERAVYEGVPYRIAEVDGDPGRYRRLFQSGGAAVYEIRAAAAAAR